MVTKPAAASSRPLRTSSGKLERMASWVGSGIYTAFVSSLDHCSCIKLDTNDISDPVRSSDHGQPLLAGHHHHHPKHSRSFSSSRLQRLPSSPAALIIASASPSLSPSSPACCTDQGHSHQLVPSTKSKSSQPRRHRRPAADPEIKEEYLDDTDEDLHSSASSSSSS